jgi:hypothetical protein
MRCESKFAEICNTMGAGSVDRFVGVTHASRRHSPGRGKVAM